jgi:hypothetical protein
MSKTKIAISTVAGPSTVRAIVRGEWAAHLVLGLCYHWSLTHVPSGGQLTRVLGRRAMARRLRALATLPPCPARHWARRGDLVAAFEGGDAYREWLAAARQAVAE